MSAEGAERASCGEASAPADAAGASSQRHPTLQETLLPFQREGVARGAHWGGRILLGDEMGLGKTLQAIALALRYRDEWPLLICCPTSLWSRPEMLSINA